MTVYMPDECFWAMLELTLHNFTFGQLQRNLDLFLVDISCELGQIITRYDLLYGLDAGVDPGLVLGRGGGQGHNLSKVSNMNRRGVWGPDQQGYITFVLSDGCQHTFQLLRDALVHWHSLQKDVSVTVIQRKHSELLITAWFVTLGRTSDHCLVRHTRENFS